MSSSSNNNNNKRSKSSKREDADDADDDAEEAEDLQAKRKKRKGVVEADEIERLGSDIIQWCILIHLDAYSLARCRTVSRAWKSMASSDLLWLPLTCHLLTLRAQMPLQMLYLTQPINAMAAYTLVMDDARKEALIHKEVCGRTWELNVKPSCGPYWYSLDPSSRGEPALVRFFHCDGSITAGPKDPIWGGQESCWRFVFAESDQYVKINYWPLFSILRLNDGRWRLENKWATYTTQPDLHHGSGMVICKEPAPTCSGCSFPRLKNAISQLVPASRENFLTQILGESASTAAAAAAARLLAAN